MNNMNMAAMNAVGGPVGGMPMMNNGVGGGPRSNNQDDTSKIQLNTYIYDYFLKNELYDCARALLQSEVALQVTKPSPGQRRDADGNLLNNGVDDGAMDHDMKEDHDPKRPDDLPVPKLPADLPENSFLHDWWCLFWDMWAAQRKKAKPGEGGLAVQYLHHTQQQQRMRQEQSAQAMRQMGPAMMSGQYQAMMRMQQNGMNVPQNELRQKALQNSSRNATPQMQQLTKNQQIMQHQMQREHSNMHMDGDQRPQSPSSAENAPSPSKRPRLDNGNFNGQPMGPNGRVPPQTMQGHQMGNSVTANQILMQHGINPNNLTQAQFHSLQQNNPALQQKNLAAFAQNVAQGHRAPMNNQAMGKGMPTPNGVPGQGSPMMQQVSDGPAMASVNMGEYYAGSAGNVRMQGPGPNAANPGNHDLQDYQLQLMLLEQQNKRRLLQARQDGSELQRPDQAALGGRQTFHQGMSPQGSRSGPSPTPQDQPKRETPQMSHAGLPGSPLPDGSMPQSRASPTAMGLHPGQVQPGMAPQFIQEMNDVKTGLPAGQPNANMMRPPSSHPAGFAGQPLSQQQIEAISRQQQQQAASRMQNQNWQQQPPQQGPGQLPQQPMLGQQPQQMGTPQQRNVMPPPQAPQVTNGNGRTQPPSPQQNPAPPTPQQTNKPNPKGKKDGKNGRKPPAKKGSNATLNAGATPASEAEPPPTPTPSTPITPVHPNSFNPQKSQNPAQVNANNSQGPTSVPAPAPQVPQQPDASQVPPPFVIDGADNAEFNLDFTSLDNENILNLDFDAFLHDDANTGAAINFDIGASSGFGNPDRVEAATGDV